MISINEEYSYAAGDIAIAETATRIGKSIREGMSYYRIGADSFAVLTKSSELAIAEQIAKQIISFASDDVPWSGGTFQFSLSMGIVKIPLQITVAQKALEQAEEIMKMAKQQGKNCYKVM